MARNNPTYIIPHIIEIVKWENGDSDWIVENKMEILHKSEAGESFGFPIDKAGGVWYNIQNQKWRDYDNVGFQICSQQEEY